MASKQSTDLASRASALYEQKLKRRLESTNPDDFVAIDPESGDYFLGKTWSEAIQAARASNPSCLPFALRVGHTATIELGSLLRDRELEIDYRLGELHVSSRQALLAPF